MPWIGLIVIVLGAAVCGWGGTMLRENLRPALTIIFGGLILTGVGWVIAAWDAIGS